MACARPVGSPPQRAHSGISAALCTHAARPGMLPPAAQPWLLARTCSVVGQTRRRPAAPAGGRPSGAELPSAMQGHRPLCALPESSEPHTNLQQVPITMTVHFQPGKVYAPALNELYVLKKGNDIISQQTGKVSQWHNPAGGRRRLSEQVCEERARCAVLALRQAEPHLLQPGLIDAADRGELPREWRAAHGGREDLPRQQHACAHVPIPLHCLTCKANGVGMHGLLCS